MWYKKRKKRKSDNERKTLICKRSSKNKFKKNTLKKVIVILILPIIPLILLPPLLGLIYTQGQADEVSPIDDVFITVKIASNLYDRNGVRLYRLFSDESNNDKLEKNEVNNKIKAAFMAAEDKNFYNHEGVDPTAIMKCLYRNTTSDTQCGASTITQQLIRLTTKESEVTIDRKVKEMLLALDVERFHNKEKILTMYLKMTPYGSNITGLKTAAKLYFGKTNLNDLTLAEVVALASIVNNPSKLSPTLSLDPDNAKDELKKRMNFVFDELSEELSMINEQLIFNSKEGGKLITQEEIKEARKQELKFVRPVMTDKKAGHFVDYVIDELTSKNYKYGEEPFTLYELQTGGYKITTTLDYNLQKVAEKYVKKGGNNHKSWNVFNAALMTTKPSTGEIITMAGSKNYYGKSQACKKGKNCKFNPQVNVLRTLQSPGSTNKPLGYYVAYRDGKLFPGSLLPDTPFSVGNYRPKNWDGRFLGAWHSAREMLRKSRNIPALRVMKLIGVNKYVNTANSFGYTTYKKNKVGLSLILGGGDVYYLEHVQAYGVFANGGNFVPLNPIREIKDKNGNIVYKATIERRRVADPKAVFLLNKTLFRLDSFGKTYWDGRNMAAKTGTSEDNRDNLIVMYSPDFVTLGWVGNNNNKPMNQRLAWPVYTVVPWVKNYMKRVGNSKYFRAKSKFGKPGGVYKGGGYCKSGKCFGIQRDWIIKGREPVDYFRYYQNGTYRYR